MLSAQGINAHGGVEGHSRVDHERLRVEGRTVTVGSDKTTKYAKRNLVCLIPTSEQRRKKHLRKTQNEHWIRRHVLLTLALGKEG